MRIASRRVGSALAGVLLTLSGLLAGSVRAGAYPAAHDAGGRPMDPVGYVAPVPGPLRVLRAFDPPSSPYGPGHRGVDLALTAGEAVLAAGAGRVTFAGQVASRGVVVIAHTDGIRTEYEPVRPTVAVGAVVGAGTPIGRLTGGHAGCSAACVHWGARRGDAYLDPLTLLHPLGPVRLLPWPRDG